MSLFIQLYLFHPSVKNIFLIREKYIQIRNASILESNHTVLINSIDYHFSEKAVLAVTLCNEKEEILGHAAFFDYPNIPNVDPAKWEEWMADNYNGAKCTALNTLFMHYFVAKKEYSHGCAREIIRTAFNAIPDLHYLFLVVPMGTYPGELYI